MPTDIACYRCGASLASLSLPLSRQDACPSCSVYLHVCKMCVSFDPNVAEQCREDDAEAVSEKERANFCEWFQPAENSYDAKRAALEQQSRDQLEALFGNDAGNAVPDDAAADSDAEDLFK